jgi:hypothetical protein
MLAKRPYVVPTQLIAFVSRARAPWLTNDTLSNEVKTVSNFTPNACHNQAHADLQWVKSSLSYAHGDCVEVASLPEGCIALRDSKDTEGPVLRFTSSEWNAFIGGVRNGEFDKLSCI